MYAENIGKEVRYRGNRSRIQGYISVIIKSKWGVKRTLGLGLEGSHLGPPILEINAAPPLDCMLFTQAATAFISFLPITFRI